MKEFNEMKFIECFNIHNVDYLLSKGKKHLTDLVKQNKPEKNRNPSESIGSYVDRIYTLLKRIKKTDGSIIVEYKHGEGKTEGRNFSRSLSIQGIPTNIKNFIVSSDWKDYDMVNCFPTLLLHLANQSTTLDTNDTINLKHYVDNRELVCEKHGLSKNDIIMTLFKDNARPKTPYLKTLNKELQNIKFKLTENSNITTTNTKNPISSIISQMLNILESTILYSVFQKFPSVEKALCFDGFMSGEDIDIEDLNTLTQSYGVKWKIKDTTTDIIVPDDYVYDEFTVLKTSFEEDNHKIRHPFHYLCKVAGKYEIFNQLHLEQENAPMPTFDEGKTTFIKKWTTCPTIKTFDTVAFNPYNKNPDPTPPNIWNRFVPLTRVDAPVNGDYTEFITEYFDVLMYNLCERDTDMAKFLKNYLAHMIQYPEVLPETIVYIRGNQGIGKDTLMNIITRLIDNDTYTRVIDDPMRLFGQFNKDASEKLAICINELSPKDAREFENKIKSFSTKHTISVEHKGINGTTEVKNCARLFVMSNDINIAKLSISSRREFIIEGHPPSNSQTECVRFWDTLYKYIKDDNAINALFQHLNRLPLKDFNPRQFKRGRFYSSLMESNIPPIINFLYKLDYTTLNTYTDGDTVIPLKDFAEEYNKYCTDNNARHKKLSHGKIETALNDVKHLINKIKLKKPDDDSKRCQYWKFNHTLLLEYIKEHHYKYEYKVEEIDEDGIQSPKTKTSCLIKDCL